MPRVIRKPVSEQTRAERLINLKAARAARKAKGRKKKTPIKRKATTYRTTKPKRKRKAPVRRRRTMTKRRRVGDLLTGGTGDVNPQYMHGVCAMKVADSIAEYAFNVPIVRIPGASNRVTIMEVLKLFWHPEPFKVDEVGVSHQVQQISFSTIAQGTALWAGFQEPNVFCQMAKGYRGAFTATGSMNAYHYFPEMYDITDGAGHGFLIASDKIFVQVDTTQFTPDLIHFRWKILYRLKTVGLTEYIGIVQSQQ